MAASSENMNARVKNSFQGVEVASSNSAKTYNSASQSMEISNKRLMLTTAGMMANGIQLSDIFDRMNKGQLDVGKGSVMLALNFLQLAAEVSTLNSAYGTKIALQTASVAGDLREAASKAAETAVRWASVAAKTAENVASAIADALMGPYGWAILAGATVAAAGGIALANQVPHAAQGAVFDRPTLALVGEGGETEIVSPMSKMREAVGDELSNFNSEESVNLTVIVQGAKNYSEAYNGAFAGASKALDMDRLRRQGLA